MNVGGGSLKVNGGLEKDSIASLRDVASKTNSFEIRVDRRAIEQDIGFRHELAKGLDGCISLSWLFAHPRTGKRSSLKSHLFRIGDVDGMTAMALKLAEQPGMNVYVGNAVLDAGLLDKQAEQVKKHGYSTLRGTTDDVTHVLMFVLDSDADKPNAAAKLDGIDPNYVVTTSTCPLGENHQLYFIVTADDQDRIKPAIRVGNELRRRSGADAGGDLVRVSRLAGSINYPDEEKRSRGRTPELAIVSKPDDGGAQTLAELAEALGTSLDELTSTDSQRKTTTDAKQPAGQHAQPSQNEIERIRRAAMFLDWEDRNDGWLPNIMALHDAFGGSEAGYQLSCELSGEHCPEAFDERDQRRTWDSFKLDKKRQLGLGTYFRKAAEGALERVLRPALEKAKAGDAGAVFEENAIEAARVLKSGNKAEFMRFRDEVRKVRGVSIKEWASDVREPETARTIDAAAEGSFTPADDRTASEYGVSVSDWNEDDVNEFLQRMNKEHALVCVGSGTKYLHFRTDEDGNAELVFLGQEDMKRLYANVTIRGAVNGFVAWDKWKGRRQYKGLGMFPGERPVPPGFLNLWQGFAVEPKEGNWSKFRDHLLHKVCGGNEQLFTWLMDWLAHLVQRPDDKPGTAVVLKSPDQGTGKSMVIEFFRQIFGVHAMSVSQSSHVVGRFNGHMLRTVLLGAQEAFWAGDKAAEGVIKNLITEKYITVEKKGVDAISTRSFVRLLVTSNNNWTVPAGVNERRFLVLDVVNDRAKDKKYFDPIFRQMEEKGGIEAMLHELLGRTITSDLRNPPETTGLMTEREYSLGGEEKWLLEVVRSGTILVTPGEAKRYGLADAQVTLDETSFSDVESSIVRGAAREYLAHYEVKSIDKRMGGLLSQIGVTRHQTKRDDGSRPYVYTFPPLAVLRESVERKLRVPVEGSDQVDQIMTAVGWVRDEGGKWIKPIGGRGAR